MGPLIIIYVMLGLLGFVVTFVFPIMIIVKLGDIADQLKILNHREKEKYQNELERLRKYD